MNAIDSINSNISSIRNNNNIVIEEIKTLVDNINLFGFGLSPLLPEIPPEDKFESPYPELGNYIQEQISLVINYPCGPILSSVFDKLLNNLIILTIMNLVIT